jgi:enolase
MNIHSIKSLFTLFSGEADNDTYLPLINSAMSEVKEKIKAGSNLEDERLSFLCAAIANLRYTQILAARDKLRYTFAGSVAQVASGSEQQLKFAENLVKEYWICIKDMVDDSDFTFASV